LLLCAIAAGAPASPRLGLNDRADDPIALVRPRVHVAAVAEWDRRAVLASEARPVVAARSLDSTRGIDPGALTATSRDLPRAAGYETRLPGFRPVVDQSANEPAWLRSAHQVRRQGVPLLRPWQNSSMFVSLGVNARGVPGIYLVQKSSH
jgi:hypothetical protein